MPTHGHGPPRKPDELKRLEGTYRKDRTSKNPPKFAGSTLRPPKELNAAAKAEWKQLAPQLANLGMLTHADKALFGVYCQAFADYWRLTAELNAMGSWSQHNARSGSLAPVPHVAQRKAAWDMMRQAAAKFGFSPSDRAGINMSSLVPPDPSKLERDDWLLQRGMFAVVRQVTAREFRVGRLAGESLLLLTSCQHFGVAGEPPPRSRAGR